MTQPQSGIPFVAISLVLFVFANVIIFVLADPSCYEINGACANQHDIYAGPTARNILEHGSIVDPTKPEEPWTYRQWPPVSGAVMALALRTNGGANFLPLIYLQLGMLFVTAMIIRSVIAELSEVASRIGAFLLLFNPNVLGGAHLLQNETLFMFLLSIAFWLLWRYVRHPGLGNAVLFGAVLGIATLTRPSIQYLILLIPPAFIILELLVSSKHLLRGAFHGAVAFILICTVLAPWLAFQVNAGVGWRLAGAGLESLYWVNNLKYLTAAQPGEGDQQWKGSFEKQQNLRLRAQHPDWDSFNEVQEGELKLRDTMEYVRNIPFSLRTLVIAEAKATIRFFVVGGEGEIHSLFGMELMPEKNPVAFYGIKVIAVSYAALLRILGLLGVFFLIKQRAYSLLFLCISLIGYTWLSHFVLAKPRFRIPVEPELAILSAFGLLALMQSERVPQWAYRLFTKRTDI